MDLKSFLPQKESESECYWALVLEPGWAQAGIWETRDGNASVISVSPSAAWSSDEELVDACDTALSASAQNLPENVKEPSKTVFGVPGYWVSEGQIKEEHLEKIKRVCTDLSLTPVGFVVLAEAISHYKKSIEGSPLNAVVIGVNSEVIEVTLFRIGNLAGSTTVARSVSVVDDLAEGLTRFATEEPFPSRFILYDGREGELQDVEQMLIGASWDSYEKIKFLHSPKVEIIDPESKILATSLAGGLELGNANSVAYENKTQEVSSPENEEELENVVGTDASGLGFVVGEDIKKVSTQILGTEESPQEVVHQQNLPVNAEPLPRQDFPIQDSVPMGGLVGQAQRFFSKLKVTTSKIKLPKSPNQNVRQSKNILVIGVATFVVLLVAGFVAWWYLPKATVTIYVSPQKLEEKSDIEVSTAVETVNLESRILPGKVVTKSVSGEKTMDTTGTKLVGDRAKGEVAIYRSGPEVTLDKGVAIKSEDGVAFTLDEETTVASGSASSAGVTKVKVTAADIGSNYNLAAGESFSVGNYSTSDLEAKNESAFSGGTSREISAVSDEDEEKLLTDLTEELERKASEEASLNLGEDEYLIAESSESEVKSKTFSAKAGDEASSVKLSLSIDVTFVVVAKADLLQVATEQLKSKVASGFTLRDDQIKIGFEFVEKEDTSYKLEADFTANLLPQVNVEEIAKKISGKYPTLAEEYLTSIEGFDKAEINLTPALAGKLGTLPRIAKNITIEVQSAD
jgi:translation initiation factor 1 (eIF-1/SUI1)